MGVAMHKREYDFGKMLETLEDVYEKDPRQFEILRTEILNKNIDSYPERYRQRAWGLQRALDRELNRYKNPVARMNRMVELFWEKFDEFQTAVNDPAGYDARREVNKKEGKLYRLSDYVRKS